MTLGIRVIPPTSTTSLISPAETPASAKAFLQGSMERVIRSSTSCSSLDLVSLSTRCLGPLASRGDKGQIDFRLLGR